MAVSTGKQLIGKIALDIVDISKISIGDVLIYSAGNTATYYVDTDVVYQEEIDADDTVLLPKTFTPTKDGWEFVGWRLDNTANGDVLEALTMGDDPIVLYAVFSQDVTLSYDGNGSTEGDTASETKQRYYNYGNVTDPIFTIKENGFSRSAYTFTNWRLNSASGTVYNPNTVLTLSENATMYAYWTYSGAPYYIVQDNACKQALTWTYKSGINVKNPVASGWTVGAGAKLQATYVDGNQNANAVFMSDSIPTNGNKTLNILLYSFTNGNHTCTVNGVTKNISNTVAAIFDISSVDNFKISANIGIWAQNSGGGPSCIFKEIRLY